MLVLLQLLPQPLLLMLPLPLPRPLPAVPLPLSLPVLPLVPLLLPCNLHVQQRSCTAQQLLRHPSAAIDCPSLQKRDSILLSCAQSMIFRPAYSTAPALR